MPALRPLALPGRSSSWPRKLSPGFGWAFLSERIGRSVQGEAQLLRSEALDGCLGATPGLRSLALLFGLGRRSWSAPCLHGSASRVSA
jgi:hypothetical protein